MCIMRFHIVNEETKEQRKRKNKNKQTNIKALCSPSCQNSEKIKLKRSNVHVIHRTGIIPMLCTQMQQLYSVDITPQSALLPGS